MSIKKRRCKHDQPVCSRFPADHTDGPFISLAVQFQLLSMLVTLSIYFNGLRWCRARPQTLQIVQFSDQILHQVVFSEAPLVEHLREQRKQLRKTRISACNLGQSQYYFVQCITLFTYSAIKSIINR